MDNIKIDLGELFSQLIRLETELWARVEARLQADHHLQLTWFEPMQVINNRTPCRVQDISAALSITVGGTSKLVDRIERAGLCVRRLDPNDRRSSLIDLTPKGQQLLEAATQSFLEELQAAMDGVSNDDLVRFTNQLKSLRELLRRKR